MTETELKVLKIIWNWGGEASVDIIAREARISIDYARLLCQSLGREDYIDFLNSKLCKIKNKGKMILAVRQGQSPKKIVINKNLLSLGRNKKGRLTLSY